jgi:D-xylose transport system permease protein
MSDTIHRNDDATDAKTASVTTENAVEVSSYRPRQSFGQLLRNDLGFLPVLLTLVVIVAFFELTTDGVFLSGQNFSDLIKQIATIGLIGLGVILVLLLGEIDLSVAAVSVLGAVVMAVLSERLGWPAEWAIIAGILAGALAGFINGFFVAVVRLPSFIVTLAAFIGYQGLLLLLLGDQASLAISNIFIKDIAGSLTSEFTDVWGIALPTVVVLLYIGGLVYSYISRRRAGLRTVTLTRLILQSAIAFALVEGTVILFEIYQGVPYSTAIVFALIILVWLILTKTSFGRHIYSVGGNEEASRRAGINVVGVRVAAFTLCSAIAAVGGIIAASRANSVGTQVDSTLLLEAIAAAVIGGVSLFGGRGSAWAIVLGMLIIGSLDNGLTLKSQPTAIKQIIEGLVLLLSVTADALLRRVQARSKSGR